jgi:DNA polymerase-3 subunit delta'
LAGSHPDLRLAEPQVVPALRDWATIRAVPIGDPERGEELRKSRVVTVGQIRALRSYVVETSQYGQGKVAIIQPAEAMNINACNALLKTLEEPPPGSMLLLVTDSPASLPATIRSRCQQISIAPARSAEAEAWLAGRGIAQPAGLLLALAAGAPLRALALAEGDALAMRKQAFDGWRGLLERSQDPSTVARSWVQQGLRPTLQWLQSWIADMIRLRVGEAGPSLANPDLRDPLQTLARGLDLEQLFRRLDHAAQAHRLSLTQVNPQLLAEDVLLGWSQVQRKVTGR